MIWILHLQVTTGDSNWSVSFSSSLLSESAFKAIHDSLLSLVPTESVDEWLMWVAEWAGDGSVGRYTHCSTACNKNGIKVSHVENGLHSYCASLVIASDLMISYLKYHNVMYIVSVNVSRWYTRFPYLTRLEFLVKYWQIVPFLPMLQTNCSSC